MENFGYFIIIKQDKWIHDKLLLIEYKVEYK